MDKIFSKPQSLTSLDTHYCPGCGHGIAHRLICEAIDELGMREKTIAIAPVGCAVLAYFYWDFDCTEAAHGRAPAVATGIKRVHPDKLVFTYQGDGDLAAIGTAETIHAANRGENISIIFVNNGVYGMTGGQLAPTTLPKQKTATSLEGRDEKLHGFPLKISEMVAVTDGAKYIERTALCSPKDVLRSKAAIKKAFQNQINNVGFSLVEILSPCPTYWGLSSAESCDWIKNEVSRHYPIGVIKDVK